MLKFDEPERRNMTIDDLNRLVKTGQLVCMCGNPRLPAPEKWSWAGLVRHVHDEQQWHTDMLLYRKSRVESKHILHNDHDLAGPPFLRLSLNKEPNDPYQRTEHASYLAQTSHITTEDTSSPKTTYRICFAMVKVALRWRCFNELHHSEAFITYHMRAK
ncbi:hypothetical protein CERSUDRAFT_95607 [Gelatoporia subvermispora B]|uniref:Uncharacterized protein n=1 Tax=Ceriporiopsis subvermispora (strain B) TaxID=914234 RepID=M2QVY9_CERS8|nr:hypothetical protein CERSUDRAFT_95607 [Gelatoporia subvermispora B]